MAERKTTDAQHGATGLVCPHCGCRHFRVVYTRPGPAVEVTRDPETGRQVVRRSAVGGSIRRRRVCRHSGRRITTIERAAEADG